MAITIRTNYSSLDAQRNLSSSQSELDSSMRKLASGYRITRAADDAAGLAVSEKMRAAVGGTTQAIRNANDGISLLQTAEGGLSEISNIVQRVRELSVQAANGTLVSGDHAAIAKELQALKSEVNDIAKRTKFNGITLLGEEANGAMVTLQVGADNGQTLTVTLSTYNTSSSGASALFSVGDMISTYAKGAEDETNYDTIATFQSNATNMIRAADSAIKSLNNKRAEFGAAQNRLGYTISVQQVAADNLAAANSRIRDVDVASESARMTRANILAQAGVSVLAQANQMPQLALKLLG